MIAAPPRLFVPASPLLRQATNWIDGLLHHLVYEEPVEVWPIWTRLMPDGQPMAFYKRQVAKSRENRPSHKYANAAARVLRIACEPGPLDPRLELVPQYTTG